MFNSLSQIQPLQRLKVSDGLLLTAEGWRLAHEYHRQRQNIHFQSLHQPGIVWGLGVCVITPPSEVAEEYRDGRWLEIQPGLAIDSNGNPIVVPQPLVFRVASQAVVSNSLTIYIAISYVDPDRLQGLSERQFIQETFRIDEKTLLPAATEIELCRVLLDPGEVKLEVAPDVFNPTPNELDLRFRKFAQIRSVQQVRVAQVIQDSNQDITTFTNLSYLARSVTSLYPAMQATVERVKMPDNVARLDYDLLHFTRQHLLNLIESERQVLQQYLAGGAVVLVEVSAQEANILELNAVQQQLQTAIANLASSDEASSIRQELEVELSAVNANLYERLEEIALDITVETRHVASLHAPSNHPLKTQPFLFAQLPVVNQQPIHILNFGNFVLVFGSLSQAWGINDVLSFSRETIRSAQELGVNILHYAWNLHLLTQLQIKAE